MGGAELAENSLFRAHPALKEKKHILIYVIESAEAES
jgi:hypothetical protein